MPLLIRIWRGHYKSKRLEKPCNKWIFSTIDSSLLLRYTQIGWSHCPYKSTKMNTEAKSKTRNKIWSKGNKLVDRLFLRKIKIHISCELKQTLPQQGIIEAEGFFFNSRTNSMWSQKKYLKNYWPSLGHKCYGILPDKRKDCGYFGIQRDECEKDRGCCFDHTVEGASWCFTGRYMPPPQMFTSQTPSPLSRASSTEGSGAPPTTEGEPIQGNSRYSKIKQKCHNLESFSKVMCLFTNDLFISVLSMCKCKVFIWFWTGYCKGSRLRSEKVQKLKLCCFFLSFKESLTTKTTLR